MGYIYIPDNPTTPSNNQPQVIVLPPKKDKKPKRMSKKEKLLEKFLTFQEENKKVEEAKEKKRAEANKPKTFTYLETAGILFLGAIPVAISLTAMLSLFQHFLGTLIK